MERNHIASGKPKMDSRLAVGMSQNRDSPCRNMGTAILDHTSYPCRLVSWTRSVPVMVDYGKACPKGKYFLKSHQSVLTCAVNHKHLNLLRFLS